jgi:hypothetical protein
LKTSIGGEGATRRGAGTDPKDRQKPTQRVVPPEEAEKLINSGWRFIGVLPNNKVVVALTQ